MRQSLVLLLVTYFKIGMGEYLDNVDSNFTKSDGIEKRRLSTILGPLASKKVLIIQAGNILDAEISKLESQFGKAAKSARKAGRQSTLKTNKNALSYGVSILAANGFLTWSGLYNKLPEDYTSADYITILANTAYSYGYGAPFLLEGQLDSPDPGCGPQDISKALGANFLPPLSQLYTGLESTNGTVTPSLLVKPEYCTKFVRQMAISRDKALRASVSCLLSLDEGVDLKNLLNKHRIATLKRLDLVEDLIETIKEETQILATNAY